MKAKGSLHTTQMSHTVTEPLRPTAGMGYCARPMYDPSSEGSNLFRTLDFCPQMNT